ncbi:MAG: hypothetical protein ACREMP_07945 [Candidatus Tyrphobacter sp.]
MRSIEHAIGVICTSDLLAAERRLIEQHTAEATQFTDAERNRFAQLAGVKRSWNPLIRAAAAKAERELRDARLSRYEAAVAEATREFERRDVPQIVNRIAADARQYRQYVSASLDLEEQMRGAKSALPQQNTASRA